MAVEVSTKQMALLRNTEFMERAQAMMVLVARVVLGEANSEPSHKDRVVYAQRVVIDYQTTTNQAGPQIVMGINVINTTTYDEATKISTCTITDIDLQSQIQTLWNSMAGIESPGGVIKG